MFNGGGSNGYLGCTTNLAQTKDQHGIFAMVAKQNRRQGAGPSKMIVTPWQKPLEGILKVNWDVAVDGGRKRIGMGAIVRDSDGKVMVMMCDTMYLIQDPILVEALAARRAVELSLLLGIQRIILGGFTLGCSCFIGIQWGTIFIWPNCQRCSALV
jgi:hypothetical protein